MRDEGVELVPYLILFEGNEINLGLSLCEIGLLGVYLCGHWFDWDFDILYLLHGIIRYGD